jgi:hypothetical protein
MSALDELRENLRAAAHRDVEAEHSRLRRRRKRRTTGVLAALLLGGAAAAGAAELISIGEPVRDTRRQVDKYRPPPGTTGYQLAATAPSGNGPPFGVAVYTARNGEHCVLAGQVRGATLGVVERGVFRPYATTQAGACRAQRRSFYDERQLGGRYLVYGRANAKVRAIRVVSTGKRVPPGVGGAFLFVYDAPGDFGVIFEE